VERFDSICALRLPLFLMMLLLPLSPVIAGTIYGKVLADDSPVAEGVITVIDHDSRVLLDTGYTDETGRYRIEITPGNYDLRVSGAGYADAWRRGVAIENDEVMADFTLIPAVFEDENYVPPVDDCD